MQRGSYGLYLYGLIIHFLLCFWETSERLLQAMYLPIPYDHVVLEYQVPLCG